MLAEPQYSTEFVVSVTQIYPHVGAGLSTLDKPATDDDSQGVKELDMPETGTGLRQEKEHHGDGAGEKSSVRHLSSYAANRSCSQN